MALDPFVGRTVHRIDAKGRVAVPSGIRNAVWREVHPGIVLFPDTDAAACFVHGAGVEGFRAVAAAFALPLPVARGAGDASPAPGAAGSPLRANPFARRNQILGRGQWSMAEFLPFDKEGRVVLPPAVLARCDLTGSACFVGCNETFQLWDPERLAAADAAERRTLDQYRTMLETFDPWQVDTEAVEPVGAESGS